MYTTGHIRVAKSEEDLMNLSQSSPQLDEIVQVLCLQGHCLKKANRKISLSCLYANILNSLPNAIIRALSRLYKLL